MLKRLSILLFLSPLTLLAGSVDVRQETVEGMAVGTVNNNFRRLEKDKLDKRAVEKLISESTTSGSLSSLSGMKNRIINGDMRIDQRNAGGGDSITGTSSDYSVDRFSGRGEVADGVFTLQQNSDAPDGFRYSLKATVTTADASVAAAQAYRVSQAIEGYNVADFGFGTAWAKTITLSFWVRSSVTGNFGASFRNADSSRAYVFSYSISSADTWEHKTITVLGDTTGTWEITNLRGIHVTWSFGAGANYTASPDSWVGSDGITFPGATNLIATLNATWYITGVQLELGDTATAFEQRAVGAELALCQRYYEYSPLGLGGFFAGDVTSGATYYSSISFAVTKRASPTIVLTNQASFAFPASVGTATANVDGFQEGREANATAAGGYFRCSWTASSEL